MDLSSKTMLQEDFKRIRRRFTQSVIKWASEQNVVFEEEEPINPPDVSDLVNILRTVGFKLRQFEKCENKEYMSTSTTNLSTAKCRVEITCGHSGLRATLESVVGDCRCPPVESAKQAEFWHVSGTAPSVKESQESLSTIDEAGSSLVPVLPPAVGKVVKDIMTKILSLTCDPKTADLNSSTQLLTGNLQRDVTHCHSLDALHVPEYTSRMSSSCEFLDVPDSEKKPLPRTVSNIELQSYLLSPTATNVSPGETLEHQATSSTLVPSPESSLMSSISSSLDKTSVTERNAVFCHLQVAKCNIEAAMSVLSLEPVSVDSARRKLGLEQTSTPIPHTRRSSTARLTPRSVTVLPNTPRSIKNLSNVESLIKITVGNPATEKKVTSKSSMKTTPGIVPSRKTAVSTPRPSAAAGSRIKKTPGESKKETDEKILEVIDVSSGSSSSASSSSSKVRKVKSVVRRISKFSPGGDASRSSDSQNK